MEKQKLGTFKLSLFLICNMIGSGIFITPLFVLRITKSIITSLLCWTLASLFTIILGISYSKLGAKYPEGNGDPYYLAKMFYPWVAVFYTLISVFVVLPGGCSIMLGIISDQLKTLNTDGHINYYKKDNLSHGSETANGYNKISKIIEEPFKPLMSFLIVTAFTVLNFNTPMSLSIQSVLTMLKTFLIVVFIPLMIRKGQFKIPLYRNFTPHQLLVGVGTCVWSFDGWNSGNFVCSEIRSVKRSLRPAIIGSVVFVSILYLLLNLSFFCILPASALDEDASTLSCGENLVTYFFRTYYAANPSFLINKIFPTLIVTIPSIGTLNGSLIVARSIINHHIDMPKKRYVAFIAFALWTYILTFVDSIAAMIKVVGLFVVLFYGLCVCKMGVMGKVGFVWCVFLVCSLAYDQLFR